MYEIEMNSNINYSNMLKIKQESKIEIKLKLSHWNLIESLDKNKKYLIIQNLQKIYKNKNQEDRLFTRKEWIKEGKKIQSSLSINYWSNPKFLIGSSSLSSKKDIEKENLFV